MNRLTEELVKGILGEEMTPRKETVGLFGGGFKPPTIGHLEVVQKAVSDYPEMDKMIVLVGSGERDSINQKESLAIWRIYQKYLPSKVEIQPSPEGKAPIGAIYNYGKNNPDKRVYWFLGEREGNEGDAEDILKRTKSLRDGKYPNIEFKKIVTSDGVSGTKARKALLARDKDKFLSYIPDIPEQDEIWDILSEVMGIMEDKDPIALEDKVLARKGASIYKKGKKHTLKSRRLFKVREMSEGRFILEDQKGRQFWVMDYEMDDKWAKFNPLQVPLHERIAYDAETRMQTRFLMKQFLKNLGTRVESDTEGALVGKEYELVYKFIPSKTNLGFLPFKITGSSGPKDIEVVIQYQPKELTKEYYSELSAEIRNTVRHELEHLAQYRTDKGVKPRGNQDDLPDVEYLTLDYEIPGHIQGLRTKAKAKKISLQQAIEDLFNSAEYDLDLDEEDFVRETWMNWLKTNMPDVSLTKIKEAITHEMSMEDFNDVGEALRNPKKAKAIYGLLLQMFPKQKEVIDYNYKNDSFAEMKRIIHGIDKYKFIGPIVVQPKEMKLDPEVEAEREKKFQQFAKGEIDKYFRDDKTDPRKVNVSKFPPITIDEEGFVSDGNHRAFIAKKQNKPLKAYKYIAAKNDHPNVAKILKLVGRPLEENLDQQDVKDLDDLADRELNPIDVDLSGNHFFDRLNDPRNTPEIDYLELEDFFTKLGDNREEFINFLNKYKSVVATDTETNINIPFMKMANKAIAKTIMRKRNFKTPNEKIELHEKDPKKGTGKKPKGSGRRLYTDENPKDTVKIKFSTRQDIVDTLNKKSFKSKSHARQSQVINLIHQRVRAAYGRAKKPEVKKRLKSALDYITKRKEASKAKTQRLKKQKTNEALEGIQKIDYYLNYYTNVSPSTFDIAKEDDNIIISGFGNTQDISENTAPNHNQKAAPFGSGYKELKEELTPQILSLTQYMGSNGLDLKPYPKIKFINNDKENAEDLLGKTAYYDPNRRLVALYTMGRHPKDILRSYAHELIHHHQNLNGTLDHSQTTNTNEDSDLDRIEREAYEQGNILFRNWEDSIKND